MIMQITLSPTNAQPVLGAKTDRNARRRMQRRVRPTYVRNEDGNLVRQDGFVLSTTSNPGYCPIAAMRRQLFGG